MRNHGLRKMKDSKTAHPRLCSKERLFSNRNAHITRQLTYHNDLMREPCGMRDRVVAVEADLAGGQAERAGYRVGVGLVSTGQRVEVAGDGRATAAIAALRFGLEQEDRIVRLHLPGAGEDTTGRQLGGSYRFCWQRRRGGKTEAGDEAN